LQVLDGANHFLHDDPRVSECIQDILSQVWGIDNVLVVVM
jgi:hypothetical protein